MTAEIHNIFGDVANLCVGYTTTDGEVHERIYECNYLTSDMLEIKTQLRLHLIQEGVKLDTLDTVILMVGGQEYG